MSKFLKFIMYVSVFVISFVVFLYWGLPYDVIKDRVLGMVEQQVGASYSVNIEKLSPYWFTGVEIKGLSIKKPGAGKGDVFLNVREAKARASIFSLLLGTPSISFDMDMGKGEMSGSFKRSDETADLSVEMSDIDLKSLAFVTKKIGIMISSKIDGEINLKVDRQRPIRSEGQIAFDLDDMKIAATELKLGEMTMPLPDIVLSQGSGSEVKLEVGQGTLAVKSFKLTGGDLELDLTGKVFLSNDPNNYRFNLNGSFKASETLGKALPFLFIVEKQKREDGSFPISITGRLAKPSVKIGTFVLPL
jgi:type II secretion system protein N